ncbi:major core protein [Scaphoideus titanus reo-like virus 1]|nr:major core protein [Scaphoideus titanus reo-like virus 1]
MDVVGTALGGAAEVKSVLLTETTANFTPVEVYNITEELRTVKITSVIADDSVVTRVPLPVRQVDITEVKSIFDITTIKRGSTTVIVDEPETTFLIRFTDSIYSRFSCPDVILAYKPSLIMHRVEVVFSMLKEYCCNLVTTVPVYATTYGDIPIKAVDLSKFNGRDMDTLANNLFFEQETSAAIRQNKITYVKKKATLLPFNFGDDVSNSDAERLNMYHSYTVPYSDIELALYKLADRLLVTQYCHPTVVYKYLQRRAPPFLTIDDAIAAKLIRAGSGVLMPRPVLELLDYSLIYLSPLALYRLAVRLSAKVSIKLSVRIVTEVQRSLSEVISVSSNVSNAATSALVRMNVNGIQTITQFVARSMLNPNFSYAHISALTLECFDSFIYGSCLLLLQALLPPSAILASDRISINNRLAYYIMKYIARNVTVDRLITNNVIPAMYNKNAWQTDTVDYLVNIYSNIFQGEAEVYNILRAYFRNNNANVAAAILIPADQTAYKVAETQAISLPYLFGAPITAMLPDTRLLDFKRNLDLPDRSPILITTVEHNNIIGMDNLNHKADVIRMLYLGNFNVTPPLWIRNATTNKAFLAKLLDSIPNLEGIYESVLANTYANAINIYCDTEYHPEIPVDWKLHYTLDPNDFLFAIFGIVPQYQVFTEAIPDFFQGSEDILILQLIQSAYYSLRHKLGHDPVDLFHLDDILQVVSRIVSVICQKDVNAKIYFTDSPHSESFSKPMWDRFIRRPIANELPPLYKVIFDEVDIVYNMLSELDALLPIVERFFIVKNSGWVARGSPATILAASSLHMQQLRIKHTIGSFNDAVRLRESSRRADTTSYTTELDMMFNDLVAVSSGEFTYTTDNGVSLFRGGYVECIQVNMRARYKLKLIKEDGSYSSSETIEKLTFNDFVNFIYKHRSDSYPPIYEIPITLGLNDLAETTSTAMKRNTAAVDVYFQKYTGSQIIIPIDDVHIQQISSFDDLRNRFQGDITTRDKPFEIWNDMHVSYIPIGVHGVLFEPIAEQPL